MSRPHRLLFLFKMIIPLLILVRSKVEAYSVGEAASKLVNQYFSSCSLFILEFGANDDNIQSLALTESSHLILQDKFIFKLSPIRFNSTLDVDRDVHTKREECVVGLIIISDMNDILLTKLYKIIKSLSHVIKKDEDYYIFAKAKGDVSEALLVQSRIAQGVTKKVLIQHSDASETLEAEMILSCLYCNSGKPTFTHLGLAENLFVGEVNRKETFFPDTSTNLQGKVLRVATPTGTRWLNEIHFENGQWVAKRGLYKTVMDKLMLSYNFTCVFFPSKGNGGTGSLLKNGTWLGSVGDIVDGNADIGQTTGRTMARNLFVGHSYPMSFEMLTFFTGDPMPFLSWKAIFWPLSSTLWFAIIVSFVVGNLTLFVILKIVKGTSSLVSTISYTLGTLLEQGVPSMEHVKGNVIRFFLCQWLFFSLIISTAYRSKLVSFLAFPNVEEPPKTFEELAASTTYSFALQYLHGAAYALLRTSPNPTYQEIFRRMELEENDVLCFQRAIGKRFVCIAWLGIGEFVAKRNLTDQFGRTPVSRAPDHTCFLSVGIIMEKRAVFMRVFDTLIIQATDTGLLHRWKHDDLESIYNQRRAWERELGIKPEYGYVQQGFKPLTNKHFRGSYYILLSGIIFSAMALLREFLVGKVKSNT